MPTTHIFQFIGVEKRRSQVVKKWNTSKSRGFGPCGKDCCGTHLTIGQKVGDTLMLQFDRHFFIFFSVSSCLKINVFFIYNLDISCFGAWRMGMPEIGYLKISWMTSDLFPINMAVLGHSPFLEKHVPHTLSLLFGMMILHESLISYSILYPIALHPMSSHDPTFGPVVSPQNFRNPKSTRVHSVLVSCIIPTTVFFLNIWFIQNYRFHVGYQPSNIIQHGDPIRLISFHPMMGEAFQQLGKMTSLNLASTGVFGKIEVFENAFVPGCCWRRWEFYGHVGIFFLVGFHYIMNYA